jgi:hypothetical protein
MSYLSIGAGLWQNLMGGGLIGATALSGIVELSNFFGIVRQVLFRIYEFCCGVGVTIYETCHNGVVNVLGFFSHNRASPVARALEDFRETVVEDLPRVVEDAEASNQARGSAVSSTSAS